MSGKRQPVVVTPALLAEQMGWSRQKAWREMVRVERAYPGVVTRKGKQPVAEAHRLGPHILGMRPSRVEREVTMLRNRVDELEQQLAAEAKARAEFQRKAFEWFEGHDRRHASAQQQKTEKPTVSAA